MFLENTYILWEQILDILILMLSQNVCQVLHGAEQPDLPDPVWGGGQLWSHHHRWPHEGHGAGPPGGPLLPGGPAGSLRHRRHAAHRQPLLLLNPPTSTHRLQGSRPPHTEQEHWKWKHCPHLEVLIRSPLGLWTRPTVGDLDTQCGEMIVGSWFDSSESLSRIWGKKSFSPFGVNLSTWIHFMGN